jgi:hypothetical protein
MIIGMIKRIRQKAGWQDKQVVRIHAVGAAGHPLAATRPSGPAGGPQQSLPDRALLGVAGKAMLVPIQATLQGVLGAQLTFGIDVAAVDSNRWRAHKPDPFGRRLVADQDGPDLGIDAQLGRNPLDQRQGRREVWTVLHVQHLDQQAGHRAVLQ